MVVTYDDVLKGKRFTLKRGEYFLNGASLDKIPKTAWRYDARTKELRNDGTRCLEWDVSKSLIVFPDHCRTSWAFTYVTDTKVVFSGDYRRRGFKVGSDGNKLLVDNLTDEQATWELVDPLPVSKFDKVTVGKEFILRKDGLYLNSNKDGSISLDPTSTTLWHYEYFQHVVDSKGNYIAYDPKEDKIFANKGIAFPKTEWGFALFGPNLNEAADPNKLIFLGSVGVAELFTYKCVAIVPDEKTVRLKDIDSDSCTYAGEDAVWEIVDPAEIEKMTTTSGISMWMILLVIVILVLIVGFVVLRSNIRKVAKGI